MHTPDILFHFKQAVLSDLSDSPLFGKLVTDPHKNHRFRFDLGTTICPSQSGGFDGEHPVYQVYGHTMRPRDGLDIYVLLTPHGDEEYFHKSEVETHCTFAPKNTIIVAPKQPAPRPA